MDLRRGLTAVVLAAVCLTIAGPAGARSRGEPPSEPAVCLEAVADESVCSSLQIGLAASPNPVLPGGTVSFSWSVSPATDCWDNLGNSAWGGYSFGRPVTEPFTWVVSCTGSGVESASLDVGVEGSGESPPPPPPGDHDPKGHLDVVDAASAAAYGWTCDPDAYGAALDVRFYADGAPGTGAFLGTANAGRTREQAVGDLCGGTRAHGFAFPLPESVKDGRAHSLSAYAVNIGDGNNVQLSGSPTAFQLGPPPPGCSGIVVLYELPNYGGRCWSFGAGEFSSLGEADDRVSSIRVADGYVATLFSATGFTGDFANTGDAADATSWAPVGDDNGSSLIVQSTGSFGDFEGEYQAYPFPSAIVQKRTAVGCKQVADASQYHSYVANRREWYVLLRLKFCWNDRIVTQIYESEAVVWVASLPWPLSFISSWQSSFVKQQDPSGSPGAVARVDATIAFCGFRFGCPRTHHPWVRILITGKGQAFCYTNYAQTAHACWEGPV